MIHFNLPFKSELLPGRSVTGGGAAGWQEPLGTLSLWSGLSLCSACSTGSSLAADRDLPASSQAGSALDTLEYLGLLMPTVCGALACLGPEVPISSPHSKAGYVK